MKKLKKILRFTIWSLLIIGLLLTMGFVNRKQNSLICKSLEVKINKNDEVSFLDKTDITKLIRRRGDSIVGQSKYSIDIPIIEKTLNNHEDIAKVNVYMTIDGSVNVNVKQRKPILRVFNLSGESYYLDESGKIMPLSNKYTARVLVANGNILQTDVSNYSNATNAIVNDTIKKSNSMLNELFALATYINRDEFWKAQIQQIYVNTERDMELIPLVGNQKIIFGDTTAMDEKFKKLKIFYLQGLNTTGWWDKYSTINLKFKNQIVCTK